MLVIAQEEPVHKARAALRASPVSALRDLNVEGMGGKLIISGRVHCFYHKQLAQEVVRSVVGGVRVINAVSVDERGQRADGVCSKDELSFIG